MAFGWRIWSRIQSGPLRNFVSRRAQGSSSKSWRRRYSSLGAVVGVGSVATGYYFLLLNADENELHPPLYPWSHNGLLDSLDHASIRRGFQVYKEVCSACHSLDYICFRHLTNVSHTEEEVKAIAAEYDIEELDDDGNATTRPGKPFDEFPKPYLNDKAARAANNGALPPPLSLIVLAREGNEDYIFSYLMGYQDPPTGVEVPEGQYYNVYFPGQGTSMAPPLFNDMITYEDGTPASASQMAKDVCTFLRWTADYKHDERKHYGMKALAILAIMFVSAFYWKRLIWSPLKTRKIIRYKQ